MLEQHNNILFMINQQNKFGIFNKTNRVHFISEKKENGGSGLTIHLFTHSHQTSTAQHLRHARHLTILPSRATSAFLRNTQLTSQDQLSCTLLENMWKISEHILFSFSLFTWIHRTVTLVVLQRMTGKSLQFTKMCDVHVVIVLVILPLSLQLSLSSLVVLCVWEISLE